MGFAKRLMTFVFIILILAVLSVYYPQLTGKAITSPSPSEYTKETAFVTRVIDGDTIEARFNSTLQHYRLLGINTPEKKKAYYNEAKSFLVNEIENKSVELVQDGDDKDRYNRKLRYLFYQDRLINVEIVERGLATTFMLDELRYKDKFFNGEKFARDNGIGLWKRSSDKCAGCIKLAQLKPDIDYFIIKNSCYFNCDLDQWSVKDDANHFFKLNPLESGQDSKYDSIEIFKLEVWNDDHDRFFMRDNKGELVLFYEY